MDFLEDNQKARRMLNESMPLKRGKKKKLKNGKSSRLKASGTMNLNKSLGPLSNSRTHSQREIDKKFKNLLTFTNKLEYSGFKKSKFDGNKFEHWRSQNQLKQEALKLGRTQKQKEFER